MVKKGKIGKTVERGIERRRTIRIRRSSLIQSKLDGLDRPSIKLAETLSEFEQAFKIVHDAYLKSGYLKEPHSSGMAYSHFSLLPTTSVFIFKTYQTVITTMSFYKDTPTFSLPMDAVYKPELDELRAQGLRIAEVGALATPAQRRWSNLVIYLSKALFSYASMINLDKVCIMVNPKHVRFYKEIFLFEELAGERMYASVGAPAVALYADVASYADKLEDAYGNADFETDLLSFFVKMNNVVMDANITYPVDTDNPMEQIIAQRFIEARSSLFDTMTSNQRQIFRAIYYQAAAHLGLLDH